MRTVSTALVAAGVLVAARADATPIPGTASMDAFYTPDDGFGHAIIAQTGGVISEIWWDGANAHLAHLITWNFSTVVAVSGYFKIGRAHV